MNFNKQKNLLLSNESDLPLFDEHTIVFNTDYNPNWTDDWDNINNCAVVAYIYNAETLIIEESILQHIINE